jgi:putative inorganic carbon (HCO3(-)) transporter
MSPERKAKVFRLEQICFFALVLFLVWLPLPLGSNRAWSEALLVAVAGSLAVIYLPLQAAGWVSRPLKLYPNWVPLLLWSLWLGWVALQCWPLSLQQIDRLSPAVSQLYRDSLPGQAEHLRWPLSVLPDQTYHRGLLSLGYFLLYLLVLGMARDRRRLQLLGSVLVFSALAQAIYGGIMVISGVEYGFFAPKTAYLGFATGTFVNRNHLAGYLEIGGAMAVGLILSDLRATNAKSWRQRLRQFSDFLFSTRLRIRVCLAVIVVGLVLTRSRGGNGAFMAALVVCGLAYIFIKERRLFFKALLLFVSLVAVDLWIVGQWYGLDKLVSRIEQTGVQTETRTEAFASYPALIEKYWRTGTGLGTFATVYPQDQPATVKGYYDHAHNDYVEFLVEVGLPGSLILLTLVLATCLHALRVIIARNDRLQVGVCFAYLMATVELALHSLSDFNLQIPANAATYVAIMAMASACSPVMRRDLESIGSANVLVASASREERSS